MEVPKKRLEVVIVPQGRRDSGVGFHALLSICPLFPILGPLALEYTLTQLQAGRKFMAPEGERGS